MNNNILLNHSSENEAIDDFINQLLFEEQPNESEDFYSTTVFENLGNSDDMSTDGESAYRAFSMNAVSVQAESQNDFSDDTDSMSDDGQGYSCIRNLDNSDNITAEYNVEYEQRIPLYKPNSRAKAASLKLFSMFFEKNVSRDVFDKSVKIFNEYMKECGSPNINSLLSYYKMKTLLKEKYPIKATAYDMCVKGCCWFSTVVESIDIDENETCPLCGEAQYKLRGNRIIPAQTYQRFKLGHPEERAKMTYGARRLAEGQSGTRQDIFDGDAVC
ncbi:hypothetical protein PHYBLDRAFT_167231 [Phycomyces blakesleeanus NRRL 1555(-)]|uniref:Uncharacterized protein n=1 Tax=Phycomyces blakesleeanus (strain ATCC 8743b / DSM 1359 / FGSC 10004 / NBRC 33097 / NRRL 1555) TaxID=763407 RepID=A0A162PWU2_PHYB8|nr:hypothetical protein PHYBLDRAFT_167231 [Phycomyces blakesleeanus NRRL 1555(-)]OAD74896.1 hypothetical protein PHYBLDRAFT_167231 [Phycomyces blakesleeanus NRRL 1555(-)]|eukprot:XP_018292936.1 hypothetical protein PHYBLDRAFT_167231 [Phycomyces blakesleeanus NRRL 1555(-)]